MTRPHPSVSALGQRRRVRLAAGLLLLLLPLIFLFIVVYQTPLIVAVPDDSLRAPMLLALMAVSLALVRTRRPALGVALLMLSLLGVLWSSFLENGGEGDVLYFTLAPVLLGGLLIGLLPAVAVGAGNLALALLAPTILPGHPGWSLQYLDAVLFIGATTPLVLLGTGFMDRSIRELDAANKRLHDADEFRLQLLNTVGHDLASPLTPAMMQLELIMPRDGQSPEPEILAKRVGVVQRNLELMRRLVQDVTDLAKVEAGRLALNPAPTDPASLARDAGEAFREAVHARGLTLHVDAPGPITVQADKDRLTQVIYNFLTNAMKFSAPGGEIRVSVKAEPNAAEVQVSDSGRGLAADEIDRLWRPFSQVHERNEVAEKGTGLGLFIAKGIIEAHGGSVWVRSDGRGHGSTFGFTLPRTG